MKAAPGTSRIRTLIVDDEPIARAGLRELLEGEPDISVIGEAGDGLSAAEAILGERPDLVFLDIQMPGVDGFGVVEAVGRDAMPPVVFVTAFDEYAIRAFEVHALDYLLKPVDAERFRRTLGRARERVSSGDPSVAADLIRTIRGRPGADGYPGRMLVRSAEKLVVVDMRSIEWIAAEGDYVRIRWRGGTLTTRSTMASMETRLDPARFARIHRSTIVAIHRVRELKPLFSGEYVLVLEDGTKFTVGGLYRARLLEALGEKPPGGPS